MTRSKKKQNKGLFTKVVKLIIASGVIGFLVLIYAVDRSVVISWQRETWSIFDLTLLLTTAILMLLGWCFIGIVRMLKNQGRPNYPLAADAEHVPGSEQGAGAEKLIIDSPHLQKPVSRFLELLFSLTVWGVFIYLLQSITTVLFWRFGLKLLSVQVLSASAIDGTTRTLIQTFYFAIIVMLTLVGWAQWNYWRFGRLNRRSERPLVTDEEVSSHFALSVENVQRIRKMKIAYISRGAIGSASSSVDQQVINCTIREEGDYVAVYPKNNP